MESELDASDVVGFCSVDAFDGGVGRIGIRRTVFVVFEDADDLKGKLPDFHVFSQHCFIFFASQQLFRVVVAQHNHFPLVFQVDFIDESAVQYLDFVDFRMVGIDADDARRHILLTEADGCGGRHILRSNVVDIFLEIILRDGHVACLQANGSPLFQTLVWFRSLTAEHHHRIRQKAVRLLHLRVDEAVACAEQYDEHENAPRHGESCQCRAQLVAAGCLPNFIQ